MENDSFSKVQLNQGSTVDSGQQLLKNTSFGGPPN